MLFVIASKFSSSFFSFHSRRFHSCPFSPALSSLTPSGFYDDEACLVPLATFSTLAAIRTITLPKRFYHRMVAKKDLAGTIKRSCSLRCSFFFSLASFFLTSFFEIGFFFFDIFFTFLSRVSRAGCAYAFTVIPVTGDFSLALWILRLLIAHCHAPSALKRAGRANDGTTFDSSTVSSTDSSMPRSVKSSGKNRPQKSGECNNSNSSVEDEEAHRISSAVSMHAQLHALLVLLIDLVAANATPSPLRETLYSILSRLINRMKLGRSEVVFARFCIHSLSFVYFFSFYFILCMCFCLFRSSSFSLAGLRNDLCGVPPNRVREFLFGDAVLAKLRLLEEEMNHFHDIETRQKGTLVIGSSIFLSCVVTFCFS
jgi:hypothetical protein